MHFEVSPEYLELLHFRALTGFLFFYLAVLLEQHIFAPSAPTTVHLTRISVWPKS